MPLSAPAGAMNTMGARHARRSVLVVAAVGACWLVARITTGPIAGVTIAALACVVALLSAVRSKAPIQRTCAWITAVLCCFTASEATRLFVATPAGRMPRAGVAFFVCGLLLLVCATASSARTCERPRDRSNILDAAIVVVSLAALWWPAFVQPVTASSSLATVDGLLDAGYPIVSLVLVGASVRSVFVAGRRRPDVWILALATALLVLGVVALPAGAFLPQAHRDDLTRAISFTSYALLGCAALQARRARVKSVEARPVSRLRILAMLTAATASPGVLLTVAWSEHRLDQIMLIAGVCATLSFVLVATRLWSIVGTERALATRRGADRLGALVRNSQDAIYVVDGDGIITYASPSVEAMTGVSPNGVVGSALVDCFSGDDVELVASQLRRAEQLAQGRSLEVHGTYTNADGTVGDFEMTMVNLSQNRDVGGLVVTVRDVSTQKQLERELQRRAFRDELTGLANRALFMDRLSHALARVPRVQQLVAVLFIDLDDFKAVNDGLGHSAGDELLVAVARRLQNCLRPSDTIARLGGDEFAVLLEELVDGATAVVTAERLLEALQLPIVVGELAINVPASIGVAITEERIAPEMLMRDADIALYRAKAEGKGRVAQFDVWMRWEAFERLRLRTELANAVDNGELRLLFQPIVSLEANQIVGAEALVRWQHPKLGTISPLDFIPLAEESGLIHAVGRWVLDTACRCAADWNATLERDVYVSVNVSARQLREPAFADEVASALAASSLRSKMLMLELTESVLIDEVAAANLIDAVVPLGVAIAIDDFGTGYSSLAYLQRFPVDVVKIDRSFVSQLDDAKMHAVIESITAIANVMGYASIAEGVETREQRDTLSGFDCRYGQGFRYSEPVDAETFRAMLLAGLPTEPAYVDTKTE